MLSGLNLSLQSKIFLHITVRISEQCNFKSGSNDGKPVVYVLVNCCLLIAMLLEEFTIILKP